MVPSHVLDGDPDALAGRPLDRAVGEAAEPDLRALQVGQHGDVAAGGLGRPANLVEAAAVLGVLAVAEVQPGDVHAGLDERAGSLGVSVDGPKRADDLGATHHSLSVRRNVAPGSRHVSSARHHGRVDVLACGSARRVASSTRRKSRGTMDD